jgi:glycosyltransferase involved in cell wall biosynthesis
MTARMKVLHVISNLMSGGAEAMLSKVARTSAPLGVDHTVISMIEGGPIADELTKADIPVHFLGTSHNAGAVLRIGALRRLVRDIEPDLVQGWMYHGNLAASIAAGRRTPVIWNVRQSLASLGKETPLTRLVILAGTLMSRTPRAIIYNAVRAAEDHERLGYARARRVIIANGFDTTLFRPDPTARATLVRQLSLPDDALIIGRVANFHLHKDYTTLFASFAAIQRADPRAHLVLVGRGVDTTNETFSKLLDALPAPDAVHILGERNDVAQILPAFDIMASSSSAEAFPNVIGEAMACGVPTVTTDAGDCSAVLGDPARVAPIGDSAALAQKALALLSLTREQRAEIGARDRARVIENYSIEKIAAEYVTLWRRETNN